MNRPESRRRVHRTKLNSRPATPRLSVEALEDRTVPTASSPQGQWLEPGAAPEPTIASTDVRSLSGQGAMTGRQGPAASHTLRPLVAGPSQGSRLSFDLATLSTGGVTTANVPNGQLMQVRGNRVLVDAAAENSTDALVADLQSLGAQVTGTFGRMVSSWVPISALPMLDGLDSLRLARIAYRPQTSVGLTTSQGDPAMRADVARGLFGIDGTGVTVGVLSDSFDTSGVGSYADDVASGDLPAGALILDDSVFGSDEGRGMAQLVYDVAPGSQIAFHTAFNGEADFAQGILDLAAAGSDVIVDDIIYFAEPMFQDGVIAQAVDQVVAAGVPYFSSAGNQGRQSYESAFRAGTSYAAGAFGPDFLGGVAQDFDPGAGVDVFQRVSVPSFGYILLSFQWDDPFFSVSGGAGAQSEVDIYVIDPATGQVVGGANSDNQGGDPLEIFEFDNFSSNTDYDIMIVSRGGPLPGRVKYVNFGYGIDPEFNTNSGTSFGHSNAAGAASVGSAYYGNTPAFGIDPPLVESLAADPFIYESGAGGLSILFDTAGNRLPAPQARSTPDFVAPDGTNTTFFGFDWEGDGFPNFFGTSAAAPHAAATAALMLQVAPGLTPAQVYGALTASAIDMDDPLTPAFDVGYDSGTGAGLIQADAAISALGLVVVSTDPAASSTVSTAPATFVVDFNTDYTPDSVNASDLTVNGIPATGFALTDGDTVTFTYSTSPVTVQGLQTMRLAAGALTRLSDGAALLEYNRTFRYDVTPLAATTTDPIAGAVVTLPFTTLDVNFNEPVKATSVDAGDFLVDMGSVVGAALLDADTVRLTLGGLTAEGTLTLSIAAGALTDEFDNPNPAPFAASYTLDFGTVPFPTPLKPAAPRGSLVYENSVAGFVIPAGDTDAFTLSVNPGQLISVLVSPAGAALRPVVQLFDAANNLLATDTADAPGLSAFLSAVPTNSPTTATYRIVVGGAGGTGEYTTRVVLNAALEAEGVVAGADNGTLATAQDIDASFIGLGGSASRGAVQGAGASSPDPDREYYSFTLGAGETVSIGLNGAGGFELRDAADGVLAASSAGKNVAQVVRNFTAQTAGVYYVAFDAGTPYTLVVTRGAEFETETNDSIDQAQDILSSQTGGTQRVLASLEQPGAGFFAISWEDGRIFELDPATGDLLRVLPAPPTFIETNPFGLNLAATGTELLYNAGSFFGDTTIAKLDIATGDLLSTIVGPGFGYTDLAVIGNEIFAADPDFGVIRVLDAGTGDELRTLPAPFGYEGLANSTDGRLFGISQFTSFLYELDPATGDVIREAPQEGQISFQQDMTLVGNELFVSEVVDVGIGSFINVYDRDTFAYLRTIDVTDVFGGSSMVSGLGSDGAPAGVAADYFRVTVGPGGTLTVETATPSDGPGEFVNPADLQLRLLDSSGAEVAADDNGSADGRNALLSLTGLAPGVYTVEVTPSPLTPEPTSGEYVLRVVGNQFTLPAFDVAGTSIPDGAAYRTQPATVTVDFTDAVYLPSLQASDLKIDGVSAPAFTVVDGDTITFTLPSGLAEGLHTLSFAAGSILDLQQTPLGAFSSVFTLDFTGPRVTATSVAPDAVLAPGALSYQVTFSEPMLVGNLSSTDFSLRGNLRGVNYAASSFSFNGAGTVLTLNYANLPDDDYTLTLLAGTSGGLNFTDLVGNALDGEFGTTFPTGNGTPGGNFAIGFDMDRVTEVFPTGASRLPSGSLVYDSSVVRTIAFGTDTDSFTLSLDAGQTISVLVRTTPSGLRSAVEVRGPSGAVVGSNTAATAGQSALVQTAPVAAAGTYTVIVSGAAGTIGLYSTQVVLNAALEAEGSVAGVDNGTRASAQDINASFISLDTTLAHASRGAVLGRIGTGPAITAENFESGALPGSISIASYTTGGAPDPLGRIRVKTPDGTGNSSAFALMMDHALDDGIYSLNEAVWTVDLTGRTAAILSFSHVNVGGQDEPEPMPLDFTGRFNGDGVAVSADGVRWRTILSAPTTSTWSTFSIDLAAAAAAAGMPLGPNFKIKFQQYDNFSIPTDGRGYDNLLISEPDSDWYSLSLQAGDRPTVAVKALTTGTVNVSLVSAAGVTLATGVAGPTNVDKAISGFTVPATGTYYLLMSGATNTNYELVVTRQAAFDLETNNTQATAQPLTGSQGALGAITEPNSNKVVPNTLATTEGNSGNGFPFHLGAFGQPSMRYQQIYAASQFTSGGVIDVLRFRRDVSQPVFGPTTLDVKINISYAATTVSTPSATFAANVGAGVVTVFDGLMTISSSGSGAPNPFDILLDVANTFNYNPANGDLLVDFFVRNSPTTAFIDASTGIPGMARIFSSPGNVNATTGALTTAYGLVTRFDFVAPPEADWYKVTLAPGETVLEVETRTPADGPGQFANTLNPQIRLFDAAGVDVTPSVTILGDGRNEKFRATGLTPGATYSVRVTGEAGTLGEYFVGVKPLRTPTITSKVDDGLPESEGPDGEFEVEDARKNGWTSVKGAGWQNDYTVHQFGVRQSAKNFAEWEIRATSSNPELFVTWVPRPTNATNATYQVFRNSTLLTTVVVNQREAPNDVLLFGTTYAESLGSFTGISTNSFLTVKLLTLGANGDVVADGVFDPPTGSEMPAELPVVAPEQQTPAELPHPVTEMRTPDPEVALQAAKTPPVRTAWFAPGDVMQAIAVNPVPATRTPRVPRIEEAFVLPAVGDTAVATRLGEVGVMLPDDLAASWTDCLTLSGIELDENNPI